MDHAADEHAVNFQVAQTHTPRGNTARMAVRPDTSDAPLVGGIAAEDLAILQQPIDKRMAALLKDHKAMGAR